MMGPKVLFFCLGGAKADVEILPYDGGFKKLDETMPQFQLPFLDTAQFLTGLPF